MVNLDTIFVQDMISRAAGVGHPQCFLCTLEPMQRSTSHLRESTKAMISWELRWDVVCDVICSVAHLVDDVDWLQQAEGGSFKCRIHMWRR